MTLVQINSSSSSLHRYYNSPSSKIRKIKRLAIFCGCTAWFVSDLVGNPEDRFSRDEAHFIILQDQRVEVLFPMLLVN